MGYTVLVPWKTLRITWILFDNLSLEISLILQRNLFLSDHHIHVWHAFIQLSISYTYQIRTRYLTGVASMLDYHENEIQMI